MTCYIGNAFSLGMLDSLGEGEKASLSVKHLSLDEAKAYVQTNQPSSCVGHADTAALLSNILSYSVEMNRCSSSLQPGDELLVGQYNGPRLPEGATSLPEGAKIRFFLVSIPFRKYRVTIEPEGYGELGRVFLCSSEEEAYSFGKKERDRIADVVGMTHLTVEGVK